MILTLYLCSVLVIGADWAQTRSMYRYPGALEANAILGENPDKAKINTFFATELLTHSAIAYSIKDKRLKKFYLGSAIMINGVFVYNNHAKFGIRINF